MHIICILVHMNKDFKKCCEPKLFKALSEPNRIAILAYLIKSQKALRVGEVCCCCEIDQSVVSRHLAIMRDAGLLNAEKVGKEVYYSIRGQGAIKMLREIANVFEACCKSKNLKSKGGC